MPSSPDPLQWTDEAENSFVFLKQALSSAPALGLPDYTKPFFMYVYETAGFAQSVLTQQHGSGKRPVAYYSIQLDPVARGLPPCLRAVAAAAYAVDTTSSMLYNHR